MSVADGDDKSAYRTSDVPYFPENGVVGNYVSPSRSANAADIEISGSGFCAVNRQYGSLALKCPDCRPCAHISCRGCQRRATVLESSDDPLKHNPAICTIPSRCRWIGWNCQSRFRSNNHVQ